MNSKNQLLAKAQLGMETLDVEEAFEASILKKELEAISAILRAEDEESTLREEIDRERLPANYPFHCFGEEGDDHVS